MYYADADGTSNGIATSFGTNPAQGDSYAKVSTANINGSTVKIFTTDTTSMGHMMYFTVNSDAVSSTERKLTFVIEYYDVGNNTMRLCYNKELPLDESGKKITDTWQYARAEAASLTTTGTGQLKKWVVSIDDVEFRSSNPATNSNFGIVVAKGVAENQIAIKSVNLIQTDLYE